MGELNKEGLLVKEELEIKKVDLGDDDFTFVRQMTGRERDSFEQSLMKEKKGKRGVVTYERNLNDFRAKLAVCTVCDEEGVLLLTSKDVPTLSQNMSAKRLDKIMTVAQELNRITEEDKENLIKNSEGVPAEGSSSDFA